MIRFNMPKLKIYQQILLCFGLIVSVPLLGVTFIINNINQQAMKKELARFTEHTAEALYRDFSTEMSWQKQQSRLMSRLMSSELVEKKSFKKASHDILALDPDLDAVGLYDKSGHQIAVLYRDFNNLSPELRLPDDLLPADTTDDDSRATLTDNHSKTPTAVATAEKKALRDFQPFQVMYFNSGNPQDSPYSLRSALPLPQPNGKITIAGSGTKIKLDDSAKSAVSQAYYYVQQKNFPYLRNLVRSNNSLYDAFYIIDSDGIIIAGPAGADHQERISPRDYAQFVRIKPGVTHEFSSSAQSAYDQSTHPKPSRQKTDPDDTPSLKKVIVKMPEISWGIIIESPYHMKQRFIKQAGINTVLLILGCLGIMLLLVMPYILGISRNFRQLIKGVKAMGEGNYYRRIRLLSNYFTPYEIVYLTLEFNRMARKTADAWQTIQDANRKLAEMDAFKSNLIDTVSHELRTPLTSIKGYTSRLLRYDDALDSETRLKSLKIVKQQADRLSRLVEDLLVIPDLESARLRVYPDEVTLMPLLENCVQLILGRYGGESERKVTLDCESNIPAEQTVHADPDRLEQIVLNLLDNAVKYSIPDSPIQVVVSRLTLTPNGEPPEWESEPASANSENRQLIAIEVRNACETISLETLGGLDSLFEKFKRVDDSMIRTTRGSGLGLYITRELVEVMGGQITLTQANQQFLSRFTVPVYDPANAPVATSPNAALEALTAPERLTPETE